MRVLIIIISFIIISPGLSAQEVCDLKHDAIWLFGFKALEPFPDFDGTNIEFLEDTANIYKVDRDMRIFTANTSICDNQGNLLIYSNGCYIANSNDNMIVNGDSINPGKIHDISCEYGYRNTQSMLLLPTQQSNIFYMLHMAIGIYEKPKLLIANDRLYYTKIDINLHGGQGEALSKNVPIYEGLDISGGELTAVKNDSATGWWIICTKSDINTILKFKLEYDSAYFHSEQSMSNDTLRGYSGGQAKFSPDGSVYARYHSKDGLFLYDFNRRTGQFSNFRKLGHVADSIPVGGLEFSPSGRFVYTSTTDKLFQYDLWAEDVQSSEVLVGEYDFYVAPFPLRFDQMERTPDGRIFMCPTSGSHIIHQIRFPDKKGLACSFEQHSIEFPTHHQSSMPHFPNYRLPSMYDQPCDMSVSVTPDVDFEEVKIYPNPTSGQITIESNTQILSMKIMDRYGRLIKKHNGLVRNTINLSDIPSGIYYAYLTHDEGSVSVHKIILAK